ncbi:MAG: hypothetical protein Q8N18_20020 [Opitutaceae bacterium]|nr:hypothetical protein [Opitutaceae bacterium]
MNHQSISRHPENHSRPSDRRSPAPNQTQRRCIHPILSSYEIATPDLGFVLPAGTVVRRVTAADIIIFLVDDISPMPTAGKRF